MTFIAAGDWRPVEPEPDGELTQRVRRIFVDAPFLALLGIQLHAAGPGWCETYMSADERLLQQHGYVHAGVLTTLADHTSGGAARAAVAADADVLTIEFKVNFLRPARAGRLASRGRVLRAGRSIVVAESEVYSVVANEMVLVSKCTSTLAVLPPAGTPQPL
jgi:uncharacterized protein (TIGR00369 family)